MDKSISTNRKPYSSSSKALKKSQIILQEIKQEQIEEFRCNICTNTFPSEEILKEHEDIHITPFCETCNKMFKSAKLLRVHQNAHHPGHSRSRLFGHSDDELNICEDLSLKRVKEEPIELVSEPEIENLLNSDPNASHYDSEPSKSLWRNFTATPPSPFHLDHSSVPLNIKLEPIDPVPETDQFDFIINEILKKPGDAPSTSKLSLVAEEIPIQGNLWTQSDAQLEQQDESWICDICNRAFSTKQILQRHRIALHDQNKDFKCDQCDMWFSSSNNHELIKHVNEVHNGFKKFICDYNGCNKEFSRRDALKRHRQTHETQKAKVVMQQTQSSKQIGQPQPLPYYNCFDCGLVFRYQTSLILHLKNHKV